MPPIITLILLALVVVLFVKHYQNNSTTDNSKPDIEFDNSPPPSELDEVKEVSMPSEMYKLFGTIFLIVLLIFGVVMALIHF